MNHSRFLSRASIARTAALVVALLIGVAAVVDDADARRLGGGRSMGRQSPNVTRQATPPTSQPAQQQAVQPAGAQPQPAGNRWLGPIAGLAAGLGIAALLSHMGLGGAFAEGLGSILLIGLLVMAGVFVWRMLRGSQAMRPAYEGGDPGRATQAAAPVTAYTPVTGSALPGSVAALSNVGSPSAAPWGVPADFDVAGFLRSAKVYFIRLQAAWDAKNLVDIREFTTPEVFAEIKMQIDEEKEASNKTDVVELEGKLLGIETTPDEYLASVRFTGKIRENDGASAESFEEVWNLAKPTQGRGGWLLAGIQQVH